MCKCSRELTEKAVKCIFYASTVLFNILFLSFFDDMFTSVKNDFLYFTSTATLLCLVKIERVCVTYILFIRLNIPFLKMAGKGI